MNLPEHMAGSRWQEAASSLQDSLSLADERSLLLPATD